MYTPFQKYKSAKDGFRNGRVLERKKVDQFLTFTRLFKHSLFVLHFRIYFFVCVCAYRI